MSRHTPGPWLIRKGDEWTYDVVTHHGDLPDGSPNSWNIATINGRRDEARDNLMLIAAAPELLAALEPFGDKEIIEQLDGCERDGVRRTDDEDWAKFRLLAKHYRAAHAAITRAKGLTSS